MMDEDSTRNSSKQGVGNLSVPPGFTSRTSFRLKRVEKSGNHNLKTFQDATKTKEIQTGTVSGTTNTEMMKLTCRRRPWILFGQSNEDLLEFDSVDNDMNPPPQFFLPKGVTHGCPDCSSCLKVTARWRPEDARANVLEEAPIFYPTEEEFVDTLQYIERIRPMADSCGICRIVPPSSWQPSCFLKEKEIWENSVFLSHSQRIDGLQKQRTHSELSSCSESIKNKKRRLSMELEYETNNRSSLSRNESSAFDKKEMNSEHGREFTLKAFKRYADDFKFQYFSSGNKVTNSETNPSTIQEQREPLVHQVEGEYRRIVENPTEEIEVLSLCTSELGSGFPASSSLLVEPAADHMNSGWNLNNLPRLPGSLLSFESVDTCSILLPRVHVGMCFSSVCWKVEEHRLPLFGYLHLGAPKIWYGIPGRYIDKFEAVMKSFPDLTVELEQEKSHRGIASQPSITKLNIEGIPVYRCIQYPGEFVLVLPGAYYSGFNCGFNITEEANFAPLDWLPHGCNSVELYSVERRKTSISYDKLLLEAAIEAVKAQWELSLWRQETKGNLLWKNACGKNAILALTFKSRINSEVLKREYLATASRMRQMDKSFDAETKRECIICNYDLHMSAAGCSCSADRYSCLNHAKQLCSCPWSYRFFIVRYEMSKLNLLLEALEGKLSAVYKWAKENLGLAMHSYIPKNSSLQTPHSNNSQTPKERHSNINDSISRIKEEIKAQLLQSKISKSLNENRKMEESGKGLFTNSNVNADKAVSTLQPTSSNEVKNKENNTPVPAVFLNQRGDGLIFSLQLESSEVVPGSPFSSLSESDDWWSDSGS